jgi:beta-mannanase
VPAPPTATPVNLPPAPPPAPSALERLRAALAKDGPKLFGISPQGNSQGIPGVSQLGAQLGHSIDIVNIFVGWGEPLPTTSMQAITAQGAIPELTLEPWDYTQGLNQPKVADSQIASGAFDAYITTFATAAAAWGSPFLLRYAHEMNGDWYPWAASTNGNTAALYVAAWRHVHDLFVQAGASDVLWVWCPNVDGPTPMADVFPGAAYVDIVGLDGYNRATTSSTWQTPSQILSGPLQTVTALAPGLPVIINETGSGEQGGSKAAWLSQLFGFVEAQPALVGVVYSDFGSDWPLTTSPAALAAAAQALSGF